MTRILQAFCLLAATANAFPLFSRQDTNPFVFTNANGLNFTQMNTTLPNVTIFATGKMLDFFVVLLSNTVTGGTIAGTGSSGVETTGYTAGAVGILTLINAVPDILNISNVAGIQSSNVASEDVTSTLLLKISKQINQYVCEDPTSRYFYKIIVQYWPCVVNLSSKLWLTYDFFSVAGAVVTHGTDVLEESAFFLDATVNCGKPVVIVGAMRPSTAISADGPYNLLEAVTVAASPLAKNRGAMVVMNDRIASAYYVTKTNANTLDTFKAVEQGFLGEMISDTPYFFYPPVSPTGKKAYDVSNITSIPRVDILMAYEDMHNDTILNAVASGAKGIVVCHRSIEREQLS